MAPFQEISSSIYPTVEGDPMPNEQKVTRKLRAILSEYTKGWSVESVPSAKKYKEENHDTHDR